MARGDPRRGLATEIELALSGGVGSVGGRDGDPAEGFAVQAQRVVPSVVWIMEQGELPRALVRDAHGVVTPKVLDFVDLLTALDGSCTVRELERDPPERRIDLPALPVGALFADAIERVSGCSYVVTGAVPPAEHPFVAEGGHGEEERDLTTTHDVPLPHVAYRAVWRPDDEGEGRHRQGRLGGLSIGLLSPELSGPPKADSQVFRWPFPHAGGGHGRVCWGVGGVRCALSEIPEKAVSAFISAPTDAGSGHARQVSSYAPEGRLRPFLEACEHAGGLSHDWLEPFGMSIEEFHRQKRSES